VLCVAGTWDRSFLFGQVLGPHYRERCVGRTWLWKLPKVLAAEGQHCCAVVARVRPGLRRLLGFEKWISIPAWVVGEVDLPLPRHIRTSGNVKKDLRKIQKNALSYEVSQDVEQFDDFYHRMHVPYIAKAHGDGAIMNSYGDARKAFKGSELLIVTTGGEHVAGGLIVYSEGVPRLAMAGVRDGSKELLRTGVIGARYHFTFDHLANQGYTKAGLGKSRAFLQNGALQYKKKLGMRLVGTANGCFYLRVSGRTPASETFMRENPLILERDGVLYGVVFVDAHVGQLSDGEFVQLDKQFFMHGLSRLLVVPLSDSMPIASVPSELASRVAVCPISDMVR
jgi:hypothetical protein